ncbi:hypothetical protein DSO06_07290, partial [Candidatus Nezhaarchaeota archaeon WYZ-LMO8]
GLATFVLLLYSNKRLSAEPMSCLCEVRDRKHHKFLALEKKEQTLVVLVNPPHLTMNPLSYREI